MRDTEEGGRSENVSDIEHLYDPNEVVFCNFSFSKYSSDGDPHNLKIRCNCSTYISINKGKTDREPDGH